MMRNDENSDGCCEHSELSRHGHCASRSFPRFMLPSDVATVNTNQPIVAWWV